MNISFTVHGVTKTAVQREALVAGEKMQATVPCLEVELTTDSEISGSLTLRFTGKEMVEAEKLFKQDDLITFAVS